MAVILPFVSQLGRGGDWSLGERLQHEIETLGFYLSGHPMETSKELIDQVTSGKLGELLANLPPPAPLRPPQSAQAYPAAAMGWRRQYHARHLPYPARQCACPKHPKK